MFTSFDKAIAAVIGGGLTIAANFGLDLNMSEASIASIATLVSTLLVWLVPNKV